jgi:hypothetical protein
MATSNQSQSFFESVTGRSVNPLWFLRGFGIASIIPLVLALTVFKSGGSQGFCIGIAIGLLVGLIAQTFAISSVELNRQPQPSDVDSFSITR